jgi:splicing factor 3A subunit 3
MEILERQRNAHEDIERMEQAIVVRLAEEPRTKYDSLLTEHQVAQFLNGIQQQSDFLVETYRDEKKYTPESEHGELIVRTRQKEIESLSGTTNEFDQFYQQLAELKEIHRRHPNLQVEDLERSYRKRAREEMEQDRITHVQYGLMLAISNMFTGEESWGRFLDLNIFHEQFLNLKGVRTNISYIDYLKTFQGFRHLRRQTKNEDYLKYLIVLQEYLESFLKRVEPLVNHEKLMNKIGVDFEKAWEEGTAPGQKDTSTTTDETTAPANSSPLFCQVCQKTYAKETVFNAHLEGKQHKKNLERSTAEKRGEDDDPEPLPGKITREQRRKEISRHEYTILKLCQGERLSQVIPATINNVERRALLSDRERQVLPLLSPFPCQEHKLTVSQKELQQLQDEALNPPTAIEEDDEKDGEADDFIYNPLKLPLGWDGKPIPFWLYKLHGLGQEYPCEICGNMVYTGRKNFEKHFGEPNHIHGLKCLGIPNGPLFKEVTSIEEAMQRKNFILSWLLRTDANQLVWEKTKQDKRIKQMAEESKIEMEDDQGNVMSAKTYNDLRAQGII